MPTILIVDEDESFRRLLRQGLQDTYDIAETSDPEEALAIALKTRPDCILVDLTEPELTGLELCRKLDSLSFTRLIPIVVMTGDQAIDYKGLCLSLGVKEFIEKPVDCTQLKARLAATIRVKQPERRREARVHLRVNVKLRGLDLDGNKFQLQTTTEDLSANGFCCGLPILLPNNGAVDVFLVAEGDRYTGCARAVRAGRQASPLEYYGFRFVDKPTGWIVR